MTNMERFEVKVHLHWLVKNSWKLKEWQRQEGHEMSLKNAVKHDAFDAVIMTEVFEWVLDERDE